MRWSCLLTNPLTHTRTPTHPHTHHHPVCASTLKSNSKPVFSDSPEIPFQRRLAVAEALASSNNYHSPARSHVKAPETFCQICFRKGFPFSLCYLMYIFNAFIIHHQGPFFTSCLPLVREEIWLCVCVCDKRRG